MASASEDFGSLFLNLVIVGLMLVIALLVTWTALIAIPAYVGYRLWKEMLGIGLKVATW